MAAGAAQPQPEEAVESPKPQAAQAETAPDPIQLVLEKKRQGQQVLDKQIASMQAALEKRMQPTFDPKALRLFKEASRPSSTGHFLEALGNMAGGYGEEQTAEINRDIETQNQKYELYKKQKESIDSEIEQEAMLAWLGKNGKLGNMGEQQAPVARKPSLPQSAGLGMGEEIVPSGGSRPRTLQEAVRQPATFKTEYVPAPKEGEAVSAPRTVSASDYALYNTIAPKFAARLKEMDEFERKGQIQTPEGIWDDRAKRWAVKFDKPVESQFAYVDGPQKVMLSVVDEYKDYKKKIDKYIESKEGGDPQELEKAEAEGRLLLQRFYAKNGISSSFDSKRKEKQMESDIGLKKFESEEEIKERNAANKVAEADLYAAAKVSHRMRNTGESVFAAANDPARAAAFGQFAGSDILDTIGTVAKGLNIGDRIPMETIAIQLGRNIPREQGESMPAYKKRKDIVLNAQVKAASELAELEVHYSQGLKGQGQVSNNERRIIEKIGPQMSASPLIVALKAQMVIARANFDQNAYKLWGEYKKSNPKGSYNEFVNNDPRYQRSVAAYDEGIRRLEKHAFPTQEKQ